MSTLTKSSPAQNFASPTSVTTEIIVYTQANPDHLRINSSLANMPLTRNTDYSTPDVWSHLTTAIFKGQYLVIVPIVGTYVELY